MASSRASSHPALQKTGRSRSASRPAASLSTSIEGDSGLASPDWRLRKHADYQRIYKAARKQFAASMTYFYAPQPPINAPVVETPRVGLTTGRVLGNAVERNRIKRRMREAVRSNLHLLPRRIDVVLHPRRSVLEIDFQELRREIEKIFLKISAVGHS